MTDKFNEVLELSLFSANLGAKLSPSSIQLTAAILMFEVIKADGQVNRLEVAEMIEILRNNFDLTGNEIGTLFEMAGDAGNEKLNLESFASKIRHNWSAEERLQLLKDFWIIAIADRDLDQRESDLIQRIADMLDLNNKQIELARMNAEQRLKLKLK